MITGHVTDMLRANNFNISCFQQQGCEALNKEINTHIRNQSSHGGGKNAVHPSIDILFSFGRRWLRSMDKTCPGWLDEQKSMVTSNGKKMWRCMS